MLPATLNYGVSRFLPLRLGQVLLPVFLGGWFLYVAITAYAALPARPVGLPESGNQSLFLDDFVVFYAAGKHVPEVGGAVYDPQIISALQAEETGQDAERVAVLPFFNPPSALLPFSLFGLLPLGLAAALWLIAGALLALVSLRWLAPRASWSAETMLLIGLGIVSSLPFYQTLVHGQMTFLLLAGFCLYGVGLRQASRDHVLVGGLLLLALKPVFLPLPLLYLVLQKRYRPLATFAVAEAGLVLFAALLFGARLPLDYVSMSLRALSWDEVNGISTYGMFGWTGFWRGLVGPEAHGLQLALTAISSMATIGAFVWAFRRAHQPQPALAAIVVASLLVSPHSYAQDLLLIVLPLLLLLTGVGESRASVSIALVTWFAAYFHFETLSLLGLGSANAALIVFTALILLRAADVPLAIRNLKPATRRVTATLDAGLPSADVAGS